MLTIYLWDSSGRTLQTLGADEVIARRQELQTPQNVLWIDLCAPTPDEEHLAFEEFYKIHPLSLEDATRLRREPEAPPHLPKAEEFPDYLFVVVNPLTSVSTTSASAPSTTSRFLTVK